MNRKGNSYFIRSNGPQDQALIQGMKWLISEAKKSGSSGILAISTKRELDSITDWSQLAGLFKQLRKSGNATVQDVSIKLMTSKDKKVSSFDGPILAVYGGKDLLDAVDGIIGNSSVLYIPWTKGDFEQWEQTWNATELGQSAAAPTQKAEPTSGVTFVALQSFTHLVNLETGIMHPSDRASAIRTLETLFHKKATVSPELICQQLIRLGWNLSVHTHDRMGAGI